MFESSLRLNVKSFLVIYKNVNIYKFKKLFLIVTVKHRINR